MEDRIRREFRRWCGCYSWRLLALATLLKVVTCQDNRCYLTNGGSSVVITVPESARVGSILGNLSISGDASRFGDIELYTIPDNGPVGVEQYTKNLILRTKLDKEGFEGAQSVQIEVTCARKGTNSLNISIPVRLIVTDVNDNAPVFLESPYFLNISEVTVIGTTVMTGIRAVDKDQPGPLNTVEYFVQRGPFSHLLSFRNRLEGSLTLMGLLDFETLPYFTITIEARDQGNVPQSAFATLTVNVQDADDQNPRFLAERYVAHLPENPRPGVKLNVTPDPIKAEDTDIGIKAPIVYSFNGDSDEYAYFELNRQSGRVYLSRPLPKGLILPVTLVIRATQVDNVDRYALTTLTVASDKPLPNELKFKQPYYVITTQETTPVGQVLLTVETSKTIDKNIIFQVLDNADHMFAVRESGQVILAKPLDFEAQQYYSFRIIASDNKQSDVTRVNISVTDVNEHDPTFLQKTYNFRVGESDLRIGAIVGRVEVTDSDLNDAITLSIQGPFENVFTIDQTGNIILKDHEYLNTTQCIFTVFAKDNGTHPRQSSVLVTVQFPDEVLLGGLFRPKKEDSSYILLIVFGVLLGTLLVVIVTLTIYILKSKQYRDRLPSVLTSNGRSPTNKVASYSVPSKPNKPHQQPDPNREVRNGVENPIFNINDDQQTANKELIAPVKPLSGTTSFISAWETEIPNGRATTANGHATSNGGDPISKESKIHNVQWPNGSIPRRVKKLSWEDEQPNKTELDPDVSVAPLTRISSRSQAQPDLTVYF